MDGLISRDLLGDLQRNKLCSHVRMSSRYLPAYRGTETETLVLV